MERHRLFEELEACNPKYQTQYSTLRAAAVACDCVEDFADYLRSTTTGRVYVESIATAPDVLSDQRREREASEHLPYTLDTFGLVPHVAE